MYELLQQEGQIGRLTLPNRVFMPAIGVNLGSRWGGVTDDLIAYYEARAKGGCGLIITEVTRIEDGAGISDPCQMAARNIFDLPDLQRLVDAVHKYDTRLFIQLQHPGWNANPQNGERPISASAIPNPTNGVIPQALTTVQCKEYVAKFVQSAKIVQMAGADGVELHGAHAYLINSFLSPAMNVRTDEYGGSFENRMRFATEILAGVRQQCGENFPVSVRINAEEALPGGIDLALAAKIAQALEQAGADAINVSCYSDGCIEPGTYEQGWRKYMAAAVKKAVSIPVLAVCNIKEPAVAEALLGEDCMDFAGVGRGHLADADWCRKAFSGREAEIRKCIGCLACFGEIVKAKRIKCGINPMTGREREYAFPEKNGAGRPVAVIGGGPAGVQAALTLKARGFRPVLMDENARIGGTLNTADKGYGTEKIARFCDSLTAQMEAAGVEARLGQPATVEAVRALDPCGVFLAMGVRPRKALTDAFRAAFPRAVIIGDARRGGRMLEAVQDAQGRAFTFEP